MPVMYIRGGRATPGYGDRHGTKKEGGVHVYWAF